MPTKTENYDFIMPELTDAPPDITATNPNWEKIDEELKEHGDHASDSAVHVTPADKATWNGKQGAVLVDGIVKGDGAGNLAAASSGADYSGVKLDKNWTLLSGGWQGNAAPYTYTINDSDIWAGETIDLYENTNITEAQREQLMEAQIGREAAQSDGSVTIKAWGDKPALDLPVSAVLRRDQR